MLTPGQQIDLAIEKPAVGGRMIARHEGQVLLVMGAIPGERVRARIERVERKLAFATTTDVLDPSADRRGNSVDLLCGGCLYSHITYPRQLAIKSDVVVDSFARIGRIHLDDDVSVAVSPEEGYRLRARFHVRDGCAGFYREGTHDLCDVSQTRQLLDASVTAVDETVATLRTAGISPTGIELTENLSGNQRIVHLELAPGRGADASVIERVLGPLITGCTAEGAGAALGSAGSPVVTDRLEALTAGKSRGLLNRHATSFFQANRFLLPSLVEAVIAEVPRDGDVLDLYAGVGIFSAALAGAGRRGITAVEGDRSSGADLKSNAAQFGTAIRVAIGSVESFLSGHRRRPAAIIVDPPRTGVSREALRAVLAQRASMVIYVSCDPPTMARDARRLVDAGYRLRSLQSFDLFPNTPHVESMGVFERGRE
jgi:23S rRNA (uracil1939-C5)-methyltransferase